MACPPKAKQKDNCWLLMQGKNSVKCGKMSSTKRLISLLKTKYGPKIVFRGNSSGLTKQRVQLCSPGIMIFRWPMLSTICTTTKKLSQIQETTSSSITCTHRQRHGVSFAFWCHYSSRFYTADGLRPVLTPKDERIMDYLKKRNQPDAHAGAATEASAQINDRLAMLDLTVASTEASQRSISSTRTVRLPPSQHAHLHAAISHSSRQIVPHLEPGWSEPAPNEVLPSDHCPLVRVFEFHTVNPKTASEVRAMSIFFLKFYVISSSATQAERFACGLLTITTIHLLCQFRRSHCRLDGRLDPRRRLRVRFARSAIFFVTC